MPYISKTQYKKLAEYYFTQEFSDHSITETIEKTTKIQSKPTEFWVQKVDKIIDLHRKTGSSPQDAAAFIARIFKPRLKHLIKEIA